MRVTLIYRDEVKSFDTANQDDCFDWGLEGGADSLKVGSPLTDENGCCRYSEGASFSEDDDLRALTLNGWAITRTVTATDAYTLSPTTLGDWFTLLGKTEGLLAVTADGILLWAKGNQARTCTTTPARSIFR